MKRTPFMARWIILAGALLGSLQSAALAQPVVKAELTRNYRAIEKAAQEKRPEGIMAFWISDYRGYSQHAKKHPLLIRKAAEQQLRAYFPGNDKAPHFAHTIQSVQVSPDGKSATAMVKVYSILPADFGNMDQTMLEKHTWVKTPQGWRLKTQEFVKFLGA